MTLLSEQREQESEQTRAQLAETLEELRARLSPGQVVDQVLDYAREGGAGEFVRNLGHEVRRNPLPVTLIGVAIGWLMMGPKVRNATDAAIDRVRSGAVELGQAGADRLTGWAGQAGDAAAATGGGARSVASATAEAGQRTKAWLSGTAEQAASALRSSGEAISTYRGAATEAAHNLSDAATRIGHNARGATRDLAQFCTEEPVVVAGLGFALGAVVGAALPTSRAEDQLVGAASDAMKENVREQAADLSHKAQNVAHATIEAASRAAGNGQSENGPSENGQSGNGPSGNGPSENGPSGEPARQQSAGSGDGSSSTAPGAG